MDPDKLKKVETFHFTWYGYIGPRTRGCVKKLISELTWAILIKYNFMLTLKVAKASEAMSNVDTSTYLKKSKKLSE